MPACAEGGWRAGDPRAMAARSPEGGWRPDPAKVPLFPREEEVPWPRRLAQAACFEQGSGSGSELRSLELGVPTRTQRRRMQRRIKKTMNRQVVYEQSHGAPSLERPPGVFTLPAACTHAWPCQPVVVSRMHL
ncbi:unnamed protein product [Prorocentrum cordatum]|uniref:Nuclear transcription factor Y subunit n=1 Tax=Prorocentrum cordatum TaxID=2364126 RepID=A0ABN9V8G8_9DINO|nr:unnamed protein product [Polarella glacialis]